MCKIHQEGRIKLSDKSLWDAFNREAHKQESVDDCNSINFDPDL